MAGVCAVIAACSINSLTSSRQDEARINPQAAVSPSFFRPLLGSRTVSLEPPVEAVTDDPRPAPTVGRYQVGQPYRIAGKWYEPRENPNYDEAGMASWYGSAFDGKLTANGEIFDRAELTAAHPTLPLPSYVRVTNLENDRSIVVRVNDRGPYAHNRMIDVSEQAAELLGFRRHGLTHVRVQFMSQAPLQAEDKSVLLATYEGDGAPALDGGVVLASAPARARPTEPEPVPVAFAEEEAAPPASDAMDSLTAEASAADRILLAFQAAEEVEQ
jgi:rare lipoprotein A